MKRGHTGIWKLYVLAAPSGDGSCFFKIGITSDIHARPLTLQTGCPMEIAEVLYVVIGADERARRHEQRLHKLFDPFRSVGEWFQFKLADPEHKRAFNDGCRAVLDPEMGKGWKWERLSMRALRAEQLAAKQSLSEERKSGRKRQGARIVEALRKGRHY